MRKTILIILSAMLLLMPLSAGGGYFSIGIAPDTAFKAYTVNEGKAAESPAKDYFRIGSNLDAAIGYSINDWLGLGLSTGVNYGKTAFNYSQGVLTVPFMAQLVIEPTTGAVRFPLVLEAGGHIQLMDGKTYIGPAFGASLGVAADVSEGFSIGYSVGFDLLMQIYKGGTISLQLNMLPVTIDMTARF